MFPVIFKPKLSSLLKRQQRCFATTRPSCYRPCAHARVMHTPLNPPFPELPDLAPPVTPPAPPFDLQIPEIDYKILGDHIGYTYLSRREPLIHEVGQDVPHQINGMLFGHEDLPFFALPVVVHACEPRFVHFLFTPVSPLSYLSAEACEAIFGEDVVPPLFRASIGLRMADLRPVPGDAKFQGINVLGANFCLLHGAVVTLDYDKKEAKMRFRVSPDAKGP
ncbi:hypothetical protein FN846DRAFT_945749 [Sphaerosporella brunnea]|uniref:Uncharacterized protein n=1 Tax=Sphaerosporella brunnea TaxID=1250544 RepID=A0A5J5F067_9PEZI|nr:hypothetical protein FN846DRAFT_945749 [Sphaerosporella brunnea]